MNKKFYYVMYTNIYYHKSNREESRYYIVSIIAYCLINMIQKYSLKSNY